ncbi:Pol protein [Phytophthora palmivora]|uniref:Pol protein n=1 Tax=Phytophthora palmivora TaxID=4796 RepID=A0A2P4XFJ4_9STRA|nr:Pol protein [Phytophthora palmivora]
MRINGVYPVLLEWVTTPPGAANLAGRHRGLHPRVFTKTIVVVFDDRLTLISQVRYAMVSAQDKQRSTQTRKEKELKRSNKLKYRFIEPFLTLARHGTAYSIDLPKSMATHRTFYVGCLKRYHDPQGSSPQLEEDPGENSPPRNEAKPPGLPEQPVSEPANVKLAGTHAIHTKGMRDELAYEPYP